MAGSAAATAATAACASVVRFLFATDSINQSLTQFLGAPTARTVEVTISVGSRNNEQATIRSRTWRIHATFVLRGEHCGVDGGYRLWLRRAARCHHRAR